MKKRVMSYSVWGDEGWWRSLIQHFYVILMIYKDFEMRIHCFEKKEPYYSLWKELELFLPVQIIYVGDYQQLCKSMIYRIYPLWDESVDYVFCRDIDAPVCAKDRWLIQEFIDSGLGLHSINDSSSHSVNILGGMCGFKRDLFLSCCPELKSFGDIFSVSCCDWNVKGSDQHFLNSYVWPRMRHVAFCHRLKWKPTHEESKVSSYVVKPCRIGDDELEEVVKNAPECISHLGAIGWHPDLKVQSEYYKQFLGQDILEETKALYDLSC